MEVKKLFKFIWELPQNALGYIILKVAKAEVFRLNWCDCDVYSWKHNGGVSLGKYIFIPFEPGTPPNYGVMEYIKHEHGHSIQSQYLGWLYLFVIGLPSFIWCNCFEKYRTKYGKSYYDFYTEKWADKLGGVNRNEGND